MASLPKATDLQVIGGRKRYAHFFEVDGTGTASITQGVGLATLVDNGTGDYTLTFTTAFVRKPICQLTINADAGTQTGTIHTDTDATKVRVKLSADAKFFLTVVGEKDPG